MLVSTNRIVSVTDANQNFTKVTQAAHRYGDVVIFKRNRPTYILLDIAKMGDDFIREYEKLKTLYISEQIMDEYDKAYKALAK